MLDFTKISLNKWKGDGQIYCKDVGELMRALGHNPKEADVARLLPENVEKDVEEQEGNVEDSKEEKEDQSKTDKGKGKKKVEEPIVRYNTDKVAQMFADLLM